MQLTWKIRPVVVPDDVAAVAAIMNQTDPEPGTPEDIIKWWSKTPEGAIRHRVVVEAENGLAAYGSMRRDQWDEAGRWFTSVLVDQAQQRQGIGNALYQVLETYARENGAAVVSTEVRDNDPASLEWANRRGYAVDRHLFESTLDLATFDASRFEGAVEQVEATGIHFFTLADAEDPELWARRAHTLMCSTVFDIPGIHLAEMVPYEQWRKDVLEDPAVHRDCLILAADGDRVVGFTSLYHQNVTRAMYTFHTSVDREYRGRGLAMALKLISVQQAIKHGAPYMRTNNDSKNGPMLAVNRKLGYVPAPGVYLIEKRL